MVFAGAEIVLPSFQPQGWEEFVQFVFICFDTNIGVIWFLPIKGILHAFREKWEPYFCEPQPELNALNRLERRATIYLELRVIIIQ